MVAWVSLRAEQDRLHLDYRYASAASSGTSLKPSASSSFDAASEGAGPPRLFPQRRYAVGEVT
jgi:hypothetical protein